MARDLALSTRVTVVPDAAHLAGQVARWIALETITAIRERGACALGLSGGRTPEPVYRELASAADIDWTRVSVFFADERAVSRDDPESNYRMVREVLLSRVPIPDSNVHRMEAERPDRDAAAREYERSLPPALDILLLGIGPDGHTASLFPGSPAADERRRLVLPVIGTKAPVERLTITPVVVEAARRLAVAAAGGDKAAAVARALEGSASAKEVPARLARRGVWFLDRAAAARLTAQGVEA